MYRKVAKFWLVICLSFMTIRFGQSATLTSPSKLDKWARAAVDMIKSWPNCSQILPDPISTAQCLAAQSKADDQIRIYSAQIDEDQPGYSSSTEFELILPDQKFIVGNAKAYLVQDPFPELAFGHMIFIFKADRIENSEACGPYGAVVDEGSSRTCLSLVFKTCQAPTAATPTPANCATDLLPLVVEIRNDISPLNAGQREMADEQALVCRNLTGFMACPEEENGSQNLAKNLNGRSCEAQETDGQCKNRLEDEISKSIGCFNWLLKCDQAAIVLGSWNQNLGATLEDEQILKRMKDDLVNRYLFDSNNVTTFYGQGLIHSPDFPMNKVYPAKFKSLVRTHLQKTCSLDRCLETFVVFLMGPATQNGSLLLWDTNRDGFANDNEIYTPEEIFDDLYACKAARLLIIADYSYSSRLAEYFQTESTGSDKVQDRLVMLTTGPMPPYRQKLANLWFQNGTFDACFISANSPNFYEVPFESFGVKNFDTTSGKRPKTTLSGEWCTTEFGPIKPKIAGCLEAGVPEFQIKSQRIKRTRDFDGQ